MTIQQTQALKWVCEAVIDSVKEAGELGAPGGTIYAALMHFGCSIGQFENLMAGLVAVGKLRKSGDLYFAI